MPKYSNPHCQQLAYINIIVLRKYKIKTIKTSLLCSKCKKPRIYIGLFY